MTLRNKWTCGLLQSTLATVPCRVTDRVGSNWASKLWWANSGAATNNAVTSTRRFFMPTSRYALRPILLSTIPEFSAASKPGPLLDNSRLRPIPWVRLSANVTGLREAAIRPSRHSQIGSWARWLPAVGLPLVLWFIPLPLNAAAQHAIAISLFMILGWATEAMDHGLIGLIG